MENNHFQNQNLGQVTMKLQHRMELTKVITTLPGRQGQKSAQQMQAVGGCSQTSLELSS